MTDPRLFCLRSEVCRENHTNRLAEVEQKPTSEAIAPRLLTFVARESLRAATLHLDTLLDLTSPNRTYYCPYQLKAHKSDSAGDRSGADGPSLLSLTPDQKSITRAPTPSITADPPLPPSSLRPSRSHGKQTGCHVVLHQHNVITQPRC